MSRSFGLLVAPLVVSAFAGCWRRELPYEPTVEAFDIVFEVEGVGVWSGIHSVREHLADPACAAADHVRFEFDGGSFVDVPISNEGVSGSGSMVALGSHENRALRATEVTLDAFEEDRLEISLAGIASCAWNTPTPGCEPHGLGTGHLSVLGPREEVASSAIRPADEHFHPVSGEPLCTR